MGAALAGVAALSGVMVTLLLGWLTFRRDTSKLRADSTFQFVESGVKSLEAALERADKDVASLRAELQRCGEELASIRIEVGRLQLALYDRDATIAQLRRQLA